MKLFIYRDYEVKENRWSSTEPNDKEKKRIVNRLLDVYKIVNWPKGPATKFVSGAWVSATYQNPDSRKYQSLVDGSFVVRFKNQDLDKIEVKNNVNEWQSLSEL